MAGFRLSASMGLALADAHRKYLTPHILTHSEQQTPYAAPMSHTRISTGTVQEAAEMINAFITDKLDEHVEAECQQCKFKLAHDIDNLTIAGNKSQEDINAEKR